MITIKNIKTWVRSEKAQYLIKIVNYYNPNKSDCRIFIQFGQEPWFGTVCSCYTYELILQSKGYTPWLNCLS